MELMQVCVKKEFGIAAKERSSSFVVGRYLTGLVVRKPACYEMFSRRGHHNVFILRLCRQTPHQV